MLRAVQMSNGSAAHAGGNAKSRKQQKKAHMGQDAAAQSAAAPLRPAAASGAGLSPPVPLGNAVGNAGSALHGTQAAAKSAASPAAGATARRAATAKQPGKNSVRASELPAMGPGAQPHSSAAANGKLSKAELKALRKAARKAAANAAMAQVPGAEPAAQQHAPPAMNASPDSILSRLSTVPRQASDSAASVADGAAQGAQALGARISIVPTGHHAPGHSPRAEAESPQHRTSAKKKKKHKQERKAELQAARVAAATSPATGSQAHSPVASQLDSASAAVLHSAMQAAAQNGAISPTLRKKIKFDLQRNLTYQIGDVMPPAHLRTPPEAKPRGSALKKVSSFPDTRELARRNPFKRQSAPAAGQGRRRNAALFSTP